MKNIRVKWPPSPLLRGQWGTSEYVYMSGGGRGRERKRQCRARAAEKKIAEQWAVAAAAELGRRKKNYVKKSLLFVDNQKPIYHHLSIWIFFSASTIRRDSVAVAVPFARSLRMGRSTTQRWQQHFCITWRWKSRLSAAEVRWKIELNFNTIKNSFDFNSIVVCLLVAHSAIELDGFTYWQL